MPHLIDMDDGDRAVLRRRFELAEDSARALDGCLEGRRDGISLRDRLWLDRPVDP